MLIEALMNLVYNLIDLLMVWDLPNFPESVTNVFNTAVGYIETGFTLITAFIGPTTMDFLSIIFGLVIVLNAVYAIYSLVMWVLRKVPFLGIKD